jgi:hypothetical protein
MNWTLTWGERAWTAEDLTGRHLALIAVGLGTDTWDISPTTGPVHLLAVLGACLAVDEGRELAEVMAELQQRPASELLAALSVE